MRDQWVLNSLGTRLMALRGLSTRTVLTAVKLTFCRLREYSNILQHMERKKGNGCRNSSNLRNQPGNKKHSECKGNNM